MRTRCRASCALTRLHYRLVTSGCTGVRAVAAKPMSTQHSNRNVVTRFRHQSVRQPIELSVRSPRGRLGHPRIQQRRIDHPASVDRDGIAIGDAALTLWFAFEGSLRERVAELLPSRAADAGTFIAMRYNDYIFILCMRIAHEEPPHRALSRDLVGRQIAIWPGKLNLGTAVNSCVANHSSLLLCNIVLAAPHHLNF
jgi:hypothetical protein